MHKKILLYLFLFLILIGTNFSLVYNIFQVKKKDIRVQKIISEISPNQELNKASKFTEAPFVLGAYEAKVGVSDARVANLKSFFRKYNSPLYESAEQIVQVSDQYQFDYRLLPAIAMQESTLCRSIPQNSHNCWGWGIYGDTVTKFESYEEAINTVAEGIKKNYINKGLITINSIMKKYTPASNGSWAHGVGTFFQVLE